MKPEEGAAFIAGGLVAVVVVLCVSTFQRKHEIGTDHQVCMTIADTAERTTTACMSGEDLLRLLREREGIR